MEYFFLLSMRGVEKERSVDCALKIVNECKRLQKENKWFPKIGIKEKTKTDGYGYGEQEKLIPSLKSLSKLFPDVKISFYHFYWDCYYLTIYNLLGNDLTIENTEIPSFHPDIKLTFSLETVKISDNISKYFLI